MIVSTIARLTCRVSRSRVNTSLLSYVSQITDKFHVFIRITPQIQFKPDCGLTESDKMNLKFLMANFDKQSITAWVNEHSLFYIRASLQFQEPTFQSIRTAPDENHDSTNFNGHRFAFRTWTRVTIIDPAVRMLGYINRQSLAAVKRKKRQTETFQFSFSVANFAFPTWSWTRHSFVKTLLT